MAQQIRQTRDGGHEGFVNGQWRPVQQDPKTKRWHVWMESPFTGKAKWVAWSDGSAEDTDKMWKEQSPGMQVGVGGINPNAGPPESSFTGFNPNIGRGNQPAYTNQRTQPLGGHPSMSLGRNTNPGGDDAVAGRSWWERGLDFAGDNWEELLGLGLGLYGAYGASKQQKAESDRSDRYEQRSAEEIARSNAIKDAVLANVRASDAAAGAPREYEYTPPTIPTPRAAPPAPPRVATPATPQLEPPGDWRNRNARRY